METDFNGNISQWDVSNVRDMSFMFFNSLFDGDISNWNVSNTEDMSYMFTKSLFNSNISNWDVSSVKDTSWMFYKSDFGQDLSSWKVNPNLRLIQMFKYCKVTKLPPWYKDHYPWSLYLFSIREEGKTMFRNTINLFVAIVMVVVLPVLSIIHFVLITLVPPIKSKLNRKYKAYLAAVEDAVADDKAKNLVTHNKVEGVDIYTLKYDDPFVAVAGGACTVFSVGVLLNKSMTQSRFYDAVLWHEIGHAKKHSYTVNNTNIFKMLKMELEADKYTAEKGYAKDMLMYLVDSLRENSISKLPIYLWIHFPRMIHLAYRILIK